MLLRKSKADKAKATKAKEAVTDQVSERTDDLVAALDAAREAIARASAAASRKAADKLLPERARQRRREAARRRNRRLLAGAAGLGGLLLVASRLSGPKGSELREGRKRRADAPRWDQPAGTSPGADPAASAEVTQLHTDGAGGDPARTPPS